MFWAERWTLHIQNSLMVFYCFLVMEGEKNKVSLPLDSSEDRQNDQSPIDFRYSNVKWWLYWKRISDLSSCLGVISTKLLSLITSNTYYHCQGIFFCASFKSGYGEPTVPMSDSQWDLEKNFHVLLLITVNEWRKPRELSIYSLVLLFIFSL